MQRTVLSVANMIHFGRHVSSTEKLADGPPTISSSAIFPYRTELEGVFRRIACDEGHYVKNARAKAHILVRLLGAEFRWILSATPMINSRRVL